MKRIRLETKMGYRRAISRKMEKNPKKDNFERSPRDFQPEYQKSVLPDFRTYPQYTTCQK
jgi:hypothetical protein